MPLVEGLQLFRKRHNGPSRVLLSAVGEIEAWSTGATAPGIYLSIYPCHAEALCGVLLHARDILTNERTRQLAEAKKQSKKPGTNPYRQQLKAWEAMRSQLAATRFPLRGGGLFHLAKEAVNGA